MNWITLPGYAMQIFLFISGISILLLAMQQLEKSLNKLGAAQLQHSLKAFTRTPFHGLLLGIIATSILQSSSIVGLMTMALVASGVIQFRCAIGVILGSNLGTTFTGWLVAVIGFKLNLAEFYLPILGLGALGTLVFSQASRKHYSFKLIFAFGLMLMGLVLMKDSFAFVIDLIDLDRLAGLPLITYFLFGAIFTAVIQSSSANMIITLSAMNAGVIDLQDAAAWIIGADLGTTSTVLIGSLKGKVIKKQVAAVHFIFNFVTDILALLSIPLLIKLVIDVYHIDNPLFGLVAIHSSFNVIGIILFLPFIGTLENRILRLFKETEEDRLYVEMLPDELPELALEAIEKDTANLIGTSISLNARRLGIKAGKFAESDYLQKAKKDEIYTSLKTRENRLTDFILDFQRYPLDAETSKRLPELLVCIRDSIYAAKAIKDVYLDVNRLKIQGTPDIAALIEKLLTEVSSLYANILSSFNVKEHFTIDLLGEMSKKIEAVHANSNTAIYELIDNKVLHKENASTLLNINREIFFSNQSLINALQHYMLPGAQARTVSEILNLRIH